MKREAAVVFVHGLARKPAPAKLQEIWLWALARDNPMPSVFPPPNAGFDLAMGIPHHFNYYADVFYGEDYESDLGSYYEATGAAEIVAELGGASGSGPMPQNERERAFLEAFTAKLAAQPALSPVLAPVAATEGEKQLELAGWLPAPVREAIIKKAAMEAYYFLFNKEYTRADGKRFHVRDELRQRLVREIEAALKVAEKVVMVTHSMGTMVAYDVLRNYPPCPRVDTLFTLGSPLGVKEVQDELCAPGLRRPDFPDERLEKWINIYDPLDPVCGADPRFASDYSPVNGKSVRDIRESNWGSWRHSATHYLAGTRFRSELGLAVGP